eukprot:Gb_23471 [translate_table: standard]
MQIITLKETLHPYAFRNNLK